MWNVEKHLVASGGMPVWPATTRVIPIPLATSIHTCLPDTSSIVPRIGRQRRPNAHASRQDTVTDRGTSTEENA